MAAPFHHNRRKTVRHRSSVLGGKNDDAAPAEPKKEEEEFLRAVEVGDIPTVRRLLTTRGESLNVNCTDILGRTPLRLAVENEHLEIVELLLGRAEPTKLYEALLLSISLDHDEIAEVILKHPTYSELEKQEASGKLYLELVGEDSQFSAETTPLIMAAQRNRFEIVSLLIRRGRRIDPPHVYNCECAQCKAKVAMDELRYAKSRLNAYKGLASEAYISLSSDDPILTAFKLGQELRHVASKEKHYRWEYETLAKKLSEYVVRLLDNVRGNDELDIILNEEVDGYGPDCHGKLARFKLAIKFYEKQFVAHPSCQKKLTSIWYDQVPFERLPLLLRPLFVILFVLVYPALAVCYWVAPASRVGIFIRTPFMKFLAQSASFFVFLGLIVTFSFTEKPSSGTISHINKDYFHVINLEGFQTYFNNCKTNLTEHYDLLDIMHVRKFIPGIYQLLIVLWITGMLWQECKQLYTDGIEGYFSSLFNLIDFTSLQLYIASFTLRFMSFYKVYSSLMYFNKKSSWHKLVNLQYEAEYKAYWLVADRSFWDSWDPMNICEGLFSFANVLSFSRLFYLLAANEQLGPLQISLRRMIKDIMRFFVIFSIVFAAFLVGLNNLYWYYEPSVREPVQVLVNQKDNANMTTKAEKAFGTIELTFRTVYWALFGMGDSWVVELGSSYSKAFTERVGYIVYGAYNASAVIVLLNMLIAMMSRSFDTIQVNEHVEWKFARAQLYMDYIQEGSTLPPPLNIMPTPKSFLRLCSPTIDRLKEKVFRQPSKQRQIRRRTGKHKFSDPYKANNLHYDVLNHSQGQVVHQLSPLQEVEGSPRQGVETTDNETEDEQQAIEKGKSLNVHETAIDKSPTSTPQRYVRPTYQAVMKRIVRRYIFEFQKDDASPMEADVEELKQDLSSFRFEMLNRIDTQAKDLQDNFNVLAHKLETMIMQSIRQMPQASTSSSLPAPAQPTQSSPSNFRKPLNLPQASSKPTTSTQQLLSPPEIVEPGVDQEIFITSPPMFESKPPFDLKQVQNKASGSKSSTECAATVEQVPTTSSSSSSKDSVPIVPIVTSTLPATNIANVSSISERSPARARSQSEKTRADKFSKRRSRVKSDDSSSPVAARTEIHSPLWAPRKGDSSNEKLNEEAITLQEEEPDVIQQSFESAC